MSDAPLAPERAKPQLEALWQHVLDNWTDDRAHGAFLEYCRHADQLVPAAERYRALSSDSEHSAQAQKRLAAIATLAVAKLEAARTTRRQGAPNWLSLLLIIVFLAAAAAVMAYLQP